MLCVIFSFVGFVVADNKVLSAENIQTDQIDIRDNVVDNFYSAVKAVNGLNYYIAGKLLWDTTLEINEILDDFYHKAFGEASDYIRRFHYRLFEAWKLATKDGKDVSCRSLENTRLLELYTPELLEMCRKDLSEAKNATDNEMIRRRIEFYSKGFCYTEMTVAAVRAAKKLEAIGVHLFPIESAQREILAIESKEEVKRLLKEALSSWEKRDKFVEQVKNDYVLAYFWIKYNNLTRKFNPTDKLRELLKIM